MAEVGRIASGWNTVAEHKTVAICITAALDLPAKTRNAMHQKVDLPMPDATFA
jgi:hypothetical protein